MAQNTAGKESKRSWNVVAFQVEPSQSEMAGWLLIQLGANGCQITAEDDKGIQMEATFEPQKFEACGVPGISAAFEEYGLSKSITSLRSKTIEEEDWLAQWKEGFLPFPIGDQLLICPPWHKDGLTAEQTAGRKIILIEPGLAFGTGFHATTQYCLSVVERHHQCQNVLDVGTGSGILAIGYALLNCEANITALETDPVACDVARENLRLNGVAQRINLIEGSTEKLPLEPTFDLILSNLTYEDNAALMPHYCKMLKTNGLLAMAGILAEKLPRLQNDLQAHGLTVYHEETGPMWSGLVVTNAAAGL